MTSNSPSRIFSINNDSIKRSPPKENFEGSKLFARLHEKQKFEKLDLADLCIGDIGIEYITDFLKTNMYYKSIELRGNNISAKGFSKLSEALKLCKSLETISLEWNNIGNDICSIQALNELLAINKNIIHINLRQNQIGPEFGVYLANIIKNAPLLKILDLRWNNLGNEEAKLLFTTAKNCNHKVRLMLNNNKIDEDIIAQFQERTFIDINVSQKKNLLVSSEPRKSKLNRESETRKSAVSKRQSSPQLVSSSNHIESRNSQSFINENKKSKNLIFGPKSSLLMNDLAVKSIKYETPRKIAGFENKKRTATNIPESNKFEAKTNLYLENQMDMAQKIKELETQIDEEKYLRKNAEKRLDEFINKINNDKNNFDNQKLIVELSEKNHSIHELEKLITSQSLEIEKYKSEIKNLKDDLIKICDEANYNIRKLEEDYALKINEFIIELQNQKKTYEDQINNLNEKWANKVKRNEKHYNDLQEKNKEAEMKILQFSTRTYNLPDDKKPEFRDNVSKNNQELIFELQQVQRELIDTKLNYDRDMRILKFENDDFRNQIMQLNSIINQLKGDAIEKNGLIRKLEQEINHYQIEIKNTKEAYIDQMLKLNRNHTEELSKWKQVEFELNNKLSNSDNAYKGIYAELQQLKCEYYKLCDLLKGNVSQGTTRTLIDYQVKSSLIRTYDNSMNI